MSYSTMYPQNISPSAGQFHPGNPMHQWYTTYQNAQIGAAAPTYYMQDEQMWHNHVHRHSVFQNNFDYVQSENMMIQPSQTDSNDTQLTSSPIALSGSNMSSPNDPNRNLSPNNPAQNPRPQVARSPFEWIKKTSYQNQPTPEIDYLNLSPPPVLLEYPAQDANGKTRTKDKYRVVYTDFQRVELEKEFYYSRYITIKRKTELAKQLSLSERQVKIWFQNRRAKERKQVKKREDAPHREETLTQIREQQISQRQYTNECMTAIPYM